MKRDDSSVHCDVFKCIISTNYRNTSNTLTHLSAKHGQPLPTHPHPHTHSCTPPKDRTTTSVVTLSIYTVIIFTYSDLFIIHWLFSNNTLLLVILIMKVMTVDSIWQWCQADPVKGHVAAGFHSNQARTHLIQGEPLRAQMKSFGP